MTLVIVSVDLWRCTDPLWRDARRMAERREGEAYWSIRTPGFRVCRCFQVDSQGGTYACLRVSMLALIRCPPACLWQPISTLLLPRMLPAKNNGKKPPQAQLLGKRPHDNSNPGDTPNVSDLFARQRLMNAVRAVEKAAAELAGAKGGHAQTPSTRAPRDDGQQMVVEDDPAKLADIWKNADQREKDTFLEEVYLVSCLKPLFEDLVYDSIRENKAENSRPITDVMEASVTSSGASKYMPPLNLKELARQTTILKGAKGWGRRHRPSSSLIHNVEKLEGGPRLA
jgi:hypothetical protein